MTDDEIAAAAVEYERRRRARASLRTGRLLVDLAATVALLAAGVLVALHCAGCGAGAIGAHARASAIAVIALQGADDLAERSALAAIAACQTADCTREVEAATVAIDAAVGTTAEVLGAYVQAVEIAQTAGESSGLLSALILAAVRLVEAWERLRGLYGPLGVELPALPAEVSAIGGAS